MKKSLLTLTVISSFWLGGAASAVAQAPKAGDAKAAPAKSPADLAYEEFNKQRNDPGAKDQARFQKVIAAGVSYLIAYPTHGQVNTVVTNLAFYPTAIDRKQAAMRSSFLANLRLEAVNAKYKEGVTDATKAALAGLEAAISDFEVRENTNRETLAALREKIDAAADTPGAGRFLAERERSYVHLLALSPGGSANAERQLTQLLNHKEKAVKDMAREELNIFEVKKAPYELKFTGIDGKEVDFAQLRGKVVALYFWNSTNKGSVDRFESLKQIHSDYRKKGFEVVTVSYDKEEDREKLMKSVKENRISFPVYFDGKQAKNAFSPKLNVYSVPRLYVFDQKGILQTTIQGSPVGRLQPDLPQNQLDAMVKKLLGIK